MKPRLVSSRNTRGPEASNSAASSVTELVAAWKALETILAVYTSGEHAHETASKTIVAARDGETELDRLTEKQQSLLDTIINTASQSEQDICAKLELWEECVVGSEGNPWLEPSDHLVLSAVEDFRRLSEASRSKQTSSSRKS